MEAISNANSAAKWTHGQGAWPARSWAPAWSKTPERVGGGAGVNLLC
ncbi:hypothetical protein TIFTF001_015524 [Ficus carica]|uniref:Uncharacterized protein n=1 Tax=Ficus carica TaxID=3494 RepID=A0AA88DIN4_FICCA|nr:hypothetical protein TIFTF001_015524 [Ficus carica]